MFTSHGSDTFAYAHTDSGAAMAFCWRSSVAPRRTSYQLHGPGQRNYGNHSVSSRQFNKGSDNRIRRRNLQIHPINRHYGNYHRHSADRNLRFRHSNGYWSSRGSYGWSVNNRRYRCWRSFLSSRIGYVDEYDNGFRVRYRHTTQQSIHGNDLLAFPFLAASGRLFYWRQST